MRLRVRDIPLYLLGALCCLWAVLCLGGFAVAVIYAVATGDPRGIPKPVLAGLPGFIGGWLIRRHFLQRQFDEPDTPGFEVLPPK